MKSVFFAIACIISFSAAAQPWCRNATTGSDPKPVSVVIDLGTSAVSKTVLEGGLAIRLPQDSYFSHLVVSGGIREIKDSAMAYKSIGQSAKFSRVLGVGTISAMIINPEYPRWFLSPYVTLGEKYFESGAKVGFAALNGFGFTVNAGMANKKLEIGAGLRIVL